MKKILTSAVLLATVLLFQFCSNTKKAAGASSTAVTYASSVKGIIETSCAPCHIAGKGNKKSLDNYDAAKNSIDDIIARIQKNPGEHGFMPVMNPKLSDADIAAFVNWKNSGLKEN